MSAGGRMIVSGTVGPAVKPATTSMGFKINHTFTIYESEPIGETKQYELEIDGESVWVGLGDDRVDALLGVMIRIAEQEPDVPDN